jgi:hypothetical protein
MDSRRTTVNRKLSDWASIAEIVGATAIVLSLIFVGYEVRRNTLATQIASANDLGTALLEVNKITTQADLAELFVRTETGGYSSLSDVEKAQMSSVNHAYYRVLQAFYYQYRRGALEEIMWEPLEENLGRMLTSGNYDEWWESNKFLYNSEFVDYLDHTVVPARRQ